MAWNKKIKETTHRTRHWKIKWHKHVLHVYCNYLKSCRPWKKTLSANTHRERKAWGRNKRHPWINAVTTKWILTWVKTRLLYRYRYTGIIFIPLAQEWNKHHHWISQINMATKLLLFFCNKCGNSVSFYKLPVMPAGMPCTCTIKFQPWLNSMS